MADNDQENKSQTGTPPGTDGCDCQDWRAQRWEWRRKRMEARRNRPFHALYPGLVLILLGGLFLADQQGWVTGNAWWQWLLIGLGALMIMTGLIEFREPEFRHSRRRRFVWGAISIALGAIFLVGFTHWWPLVLVGAGVAVWLGGVW